MKNKKIWVAALIVSIVATWVLISPAMEVYFGINMPFVIINHQQFTCFGFEIPNDKQLGVMLLSGVLLMLPARLIHFSMIKLGEKPNKHRYDDDLGLGQHRGYHSMHAYDEDGNLTK